MARSTHDEPTVILQILQHIHKQACVAGAVADAFYGGVPQQIVNAVRERLPSQLL